MSRFPIPAAALALMLAFAAGPAFSQTPGPSLSPPRPATLQPSTVPVSPAHLQMARDVVILSGVTGTFTGIYTEFGNSVRQNLTTRPETKKDLDEVLAQLKPEADKRVEDMINASARVFATRMNETDLKEVQAFFNSPVGRRYSAIRPQMIDEIFTQLQPWSFQTSDFLYNFTRDEMKKRGHDIGG